jgi:beta-glucosidase
MDRIGRRLLVLAGAALVAAGVASSIGVAAPRATPLQQANALLPQMTRDEKISLVANGGAGVPRLGIPALAPSDGPNGIRNGSPPRTAFPNAQVLAASWDTTLAQRFGGAVGDEAVAKGFNILLGPTVNILRTPLWGRAAETLGEDPFLSGQIAAAEVRGLQSRHVIAEVKHYAANNQEIERHGDLFNGLSPAVNVIVSDRALREIYFPAFAAAVQDGGAMSVMCAYPQVNGAYACKNPSLLGALKQDLGFTGFVGVDATLAVRDALAAANAGTDNFELGVLLGIPPAQAAAQVSPERLDDKVRRILTALATVGLLDGPVGPESTDHLALAAQIAAEGTVLLKNESGALPIRSGVRSIAVIGYDAGPGTQNMEGGSAAVVGGPVVTPLDAITARAGQGVAVTYAPGTLGVVPLPIVPSAVLTPSSGTGPGLLGTYYASIDESGSPLGVFVSPTIDFGTALTPPGSHSARFTGTLTPTATGTHRFSLEHAGNARLTMDGRLVANGDTEGLGPSLGLVGAPPQTFQGLADLTAGHAVPIQLDYSIGASVVGSPLHLGWAPPDAAPVQAAVAAARAAEVAVVFVNDVTGEGMDRSGLGLPGDQDALIEAVAAANPRTVVVLHTSGPVLMPWLSSVAAVVQAWYPGERSGEAVAAVLFGDVNPSGKLPMTFPADESQGVARTPAEYPGVDGAVHYDEGIFVGYRFYDQFGQEPLFPFGHGLSYTTFALDHLRLTRRARGTLHVSVRVTNTGTVAGAEVVQLYIGFPESTSEPPNQLKGFAKVRLRPGQRQRVRMTLRQPSFAVWDDGPAVVPGTYALRVGTSSRALPLAASIELAGGE